MKLPKGVRRGKFEMAKSGWPKRNGDHYEEVKGYLIGSFAIRREGPGYWKLSHAATGMGMGCAWHESIAEAAKMARRLERLTDWQKVKRGHKPGSPIGLSKALAEKTRRVLKTYPHLKHVFWGS